MSVCEGWSTVARVQDIFVHKDSITKKGHKRQNKETRRRPRRYTLTFTAVASSVQACFSNNTLSRRQCARSE